MLQSIRERAHGWFAWVLFSLISLTFIFWGVHNYTDSNVSDIVATINGADIHQAELQTAYERLRTQQQFQFSKNAISADTEKQFKQQALQELIINNGLTQAALSEGLRFTLEQAIANIRLMPTFQVNGQFSTEKFKQILSGLSYTEAQFIANLQSAMLINQMRVGVMNSAYALTNEVEMILKLVKQHRDIKYLIIPIKQLAKSIAVSTQEIQTYYEQHLKDFQVPEQVNVEYLELTLKDLKSHFKFTDIQLKQFYVANSALFTKQAVTQPFATVKQQVADIMIQQKSEQLFAEQSEKLANLTFSNPATLDIAAKELDLPIQTSALFTSSGAKTGIAVNNKVVTAAFSNDVLRHGNNSSLIELDPQHIVVLRIKKHIPTNIRPLADVKATITKRLQAVQAQEIANKISIDIIDGLAQGKDITKLFKQYHLAWITKAQVGRYDNSIPSQVLTKAFQLPISNNRQVAAGKVLLPVGDYAVVIANKMYTGDGQLNLSELQIFKKQLEHLYGQFDYGLYVDCVFKKAKVKLKAAA